MAAAGIAIVVVLVVLVLILFAAVKIARKIGELVHDAASAGGGSAGSALVVDYGAEKAFGDSFRVSVAYLYGV